MEIIPELSEDDCGINLYLILDNFKLYAKDCVHLIYTVKINIYSQNIIPINIIYSDYNNVDWKYIISECKGYLLINSIVEEKEKSVYSTTTDTKVFFSKYVIIFDENRTLDFSHENNTIVIENINNIYLTNTIERLFKIN